MSMYKWECYHNIKKASWKVANGAAGVFYVSGISAAPICVIHMCAGCGIFRWLLESFSGDPNHLCMLCLSAAWAVWGAGIELAGICGPIVSAVCVCDLGYAGCWV